MFIFPFLVYPRRLLVEKERSRTHSGVVAPVSVTPEGKPAYCSVCKPGCAAKKSVLPFCCVEPGIPTIGRRDNALCFWQNAKVEERQRNQKQWRYCF